MNASETEPRALITSCQGLVRNIAWQIHRRLPPQVDLDDLIGFGQIGLAEAARDFDPSRCGQFTTFAYYRIRGSILDGLAKMRWFSRVDYDRGRYERLAHDTLHEENSDGDSSRTRAIEDDARWLTRVSGAMAVVHLLCRSDDGESAEAQLEDPDMPLPDEAAMKREMVDKLHQLVAALPDESRELIQAAYFEGLTLTEAAKRLGFSKAWASRLHAKTLSQLAESFRLAGMVE